MWTTLWVIEHGGMVAVEDDQQCPSITGKQPERTVQRLETAGSLKLDQCFSAPQKFTGSSDIEWFQRDAGCST
jgi:hypothetical protein